MIEYKTLKNFLDNSFIRGDAKCFVNGKDIQSITIKTVLKNFPKGKCEINLVEDISKPQEILFE